MGHAGATCSGNEICHMIVTGCDNSAELASLGDLHDLPAHGGYTVSAKCALTDLP